MPLFSGSALEEVVLKISRFGGTGHQTGRGRGGLHGGGGALGLDDGAAGVEALPEARLGRDR
ncbi:hypothetical protein GVN21_02185 [Caulobacter sp. SLTY]|uniref:hypothetical protein n=1 Tax=Caulobacter sp. SLTY TaxID=2683262 RepID=UPI0014120AD9|nr:hypothetical protein [Caulobacter sp. SLTY]NBB14160.1 hypothetical protein [Caulobacter sp. SLTY]